MQLIDQPLVIDSRSIRRALVSCDSNSPENSTGSRLTWLVLLRRRSYLHKIFIVQSIYLMVFTCSSSFSRSMKGESIKKILSSGVVGSSESSRPRLLSLFTSLLSTSIVVSESGPGLAGSERTYSRLMWWFLNVSTFFLILIGCWPYLHWRLQDSLLVPLKHTACGNWIYSLLKKTLGDHFFPYIWLEISSLLEGRQRYTPLHCMPWRKSPFSSRLQYWQMVGRV